MVTKKLHTVTIDFQGARSKADLFARVATALALPAHFGNNLDALHDCLTDLPVKANTPWRIELTNVPKLAAAQDIGATFADASAFFKKQGATLEIVQA